MPVTKSLHARCITNCHSYNSVYILVGSIAR